MAKVIIKLTPYDALQILTFLTEMKADMDHPYFESLKKSIQNYRNELVAKMSMDQIDDAYADRAVNTLLGKEPE
jgi:hypothetical protein